MPNNGIIKPFQYFTKDGEHFCPKCGKSNGKIRYAVRKLCSGGFLKSCPGKEHFHHKCKMCGGKWMESTYESSRNEVLSTLKTTIEWALENKIKPGEIQGMINNHLVKEIMES